MVAITTYGYVILLAQLVKNPPAMQDTPVQFLGSGRSPGEGIGYTCLCSWASLVAQLVKNLPAMWETWVPSLGGEDLLEKGKAAYPLQYSGLENSMDCIVKGVTKSQTWLSIFHCGVLECGLSKLGCAVNVKYTLDSKYLAKKKKKNLSNIFVCITC